jgi:hypothetical protein
MMVHGEQKSGIGFNVPSEVGPFKRLPILA